MENLHDDPHTYESNPRQARISSAVARAIAELIADFSQDKQDAEAAVNGLVHALGYVTGLSFCPRCEAGWMTFVNRMVPEIAERTRILAGENTPCTLHH